MNALKKAFISTLIFASTSAASFAQTLQPESQQEFRRIFGFSPGAGVVNLTAARPRAARHTVSQPTIYAARARHSANAAVRLCL
jgi:hypothetical protein